MTPEHIELCKRLRHVETVHHDGVYDSPTNPDGRQAADTIESLAAENERYKSDYSRLRREVERLRAALTLAANRLDWHAVACIAAGDPHAHEKSEWADDARHAALKGGDA